MCNTQHTARPHLSQDDRAVIEALHREGASSRAIAKVINRHHTTIGRELRRNQNINSAYTASSAQKRYAIRRQHAKYGARKIENNATLCSHIEEKLRGTHERGDWSPEIIAQFTHNISHQTIYAWIRRSRPDLFRLLPRRGKYRRKYGSLKAPSRGWTTHIRSIETRPHEVEQRTTLGHYEGDTILLNRSLAILTVVERKSRFLIASLVSARVGMAYAVHEALVAQFSTLPGSLCQTLTPDRGGEFAYWDMTEKEIEGLTIYFAHPHSPWERGTNEHTNGLVRRYFSKKEKHDMLTQAQVTRVVWMLNHRPRKLLNWETPCRVFGGCCTSN